MGKYYRESKEYTPISMYLESPHIIVSSDTQLRFVPYYEDENSANYVDHYDEKSKRWVCELGCGFRLRRDADEVLGEDLAALDKCYSKLGFADTVRESFSVAWTYNYDRDIFSCSYEITEYTCCRKRSAKFSVTRVGMKELDEIEKALRAWHATGEMIWEGIFIELGDWQNREYIPEPKESHAHETEKLEDEIPFFSFSESCAAADGDKIPRCDES